WSGAVEAFRDALDIEVGLAAAVQGLEAVLQATIGDGSGELPDGLLDALETAYQANSNTAGLATVAKVRLRDADGPDRVALLQTHNQANGNTAGHTTVAKGRLRDADAPVRVALLQTLGNLLEQGGGTPAEALEAWGALLALDPASVLALERALAIAERPELGRRCGELLGADVEVARDSGRISAGLCLSATRLWLRKLDAPDQALIVLQPLLDDQPEHTDGLGLLVETARALGEPKQLHDALRRGATAQVDPQAAAALWREAANVAESALAEPALAIEDLRQLIDADESDRPGWTRLLALLAQAGDHEAYSDALNRRVMITDDDAERRELRYRLANHLVDKLERPEDAIVVYNDMLGADPNDMVALGELEVLLRRLGRWQEVRELLERKLDVVEGEARIAVQEEMARLA